MVQGIGHVGENLDRFNTQATQAVTIFNVFLFSFSKMFNQLHGARRESVRMPDRFAASRPANFRRTVVSRLELAHRETERQRRLEEHEFYRQVEELRNARVALGQLREQPRTPEVKVRRSLLKMRIAASEQFKYEFLHAFGEREEEIPAHLSNLETHWLDTGAARMSGPSDPARVLLHRSEHARPDSPRPTPAQVANFFTVRAQAMAIPEESALARPERGSTGVSVEEGDNSQVTGRMVSWEGPGVIPPANMTSPGERVGQGRGQS